MRPASRARSQRAFASSKHAAKLSVAWGHGHSSPSATRVNCACCCALRSRIGKAENLASMPCFSEEVLGCADRVASALEDASAEELAHRPSTKHIQAEAGRRDHK